MIITIIFSMILRMIYRYGLYNEIMKQRRFSIVQLSYISVCDDDDYYYNSYQSIFHTTLTQLSPVCDMMDR